MKKFIKTIILLLSLVIIIDSQANTNNSSLTSEKKQELKKYIMSIPLRQPLTQQEMDRFIELVEFFEVTIPIDETQMGKQLSWEIGTIMGYGNMVEMLELTNNQYLLSYYTKVADYLMSELNDPITGEVDYLTEKKAPVWYWKLEKPETGSDLDTSRANKVKNWLTTQKHIEPKNPVYWADPLSNGLGYSFVGRLAVYILNNPELGKLEVPTAYNYYPASGKTYKEKAINWVLKGKETYSYYLDTVWFDKKLNLWRLPKDSSVDKYSTFYQDSVLPSNRYLVHDLGFNYIIEGLKIIDKEKHASFIEQGEKVISSGIDYWKEHLVKRRNEDGLYYLWYYRAIPENPPKNFEDDSHVNITLYCLFELAQSGKYNISKEDTKAVENTALNYMYSNEHKKKFRFIGNEEILRPDSKIHHLTLHPRTKNVYNFYAPIERTGITRFIVTRKLMLNRGVPFIAELLSTKAFIYGVEK